MSDTVGGHAREAEGDDTARLLTRAVAARDFVERTRLRPELVLALERCRSAGSERASRERALSEALAAIDARSAAEVDASARAIADGSLRGPRLRAFLESMSAHPLDFAAPHFGDEPVDVFLEMLLGTHGRHDGGPSPGVDMIHYDPSPASAALTLARDGWFDAGEVFVDLGSGIGRVPILGALLGEGTCVGVEIDPELHAVAARGVLALDARRATLRLGDARTVPIEDGTSFFFFAPFVGVVLDAVLARLERVARARPIRVGSWGPGTARIAEAPFLKADRPSPGPFDLVTFTSRFHPDRIAD